MDWDLRPYPSHFHSAIQTVLAQQHHIGWLSCLKGFLGKAWSDLSNLHATRASLKDHTSGRNRLRMVMSALHTLSCDLWKGRNDYLHRKSALDAATLRNAEDEEITQLHSQKESLGPSDHHYVSRPIDKILKQNPSNRRRWIRQVIWLIKARFLNFFPVS